MKFTISATFLATVALAPVVAALVASTNVLPVCGKAVLKTAYDHVKCRKPLPVDRDCWCLDAGFRAAYETGVSKACPSPADKTRYQDQVNLADCIGVQGFWGVVIK
ncbi:hypothetical protein Vi05172_g2525 [Venturia inaequalis]|nr:hypothetical protein Vi05172_g2525 [Venturia inaequalis]